jgi:hypothetical protein
MMPLKDVRRKKREKSHKIILVEVFDEILPVAVETK